MKKVIFLHSGFRSASTYFFNKFEELNSFTCYQEPLHENILDAKGDKESLLSMGDPNSIHLRHHKNNNYYQSIIDLDESDISYCNPSEVYKNFFDNDLDENVSNYLADLIRLGGDKIFIQECRLLNRIAATKAKLGGVHFFLYRNPVDQWWSGKVSRYFETMHKVSSLSLGAPPALAALAKDLQLESVEAPNLSDEIFTHWWKVLNPKQSYMLFYMPWSLAVMEGLKASDYMISIDKLSRSDEYKARIQDLLKNNFDVDNIDFQDASIPSMSFSDDEIIWYKEIEAEIHGRLLESGVPEDSLAALVRIRSDIYDVCINAKDSTSSSLELSLRNLCYRLEEEIVSYRHHLNLESDTPDISSILDGYQPLIAQIIAERVVFNGQYKSLYSASLNELTELKIKNKSLICENLRLKDIEKTAEKKTLLLKQMIKLSAKLDEENTIHEAFLSASLEHSAKLLLNFEDSQSMNQNLQKELDDFKQKYNNILLSHSWRITKPLRFLFRMLGISK
jgi:hypothetical protein